MASIPLRPLLGTAAALLTAAVLPAGAGAATWGSVPGIPVPDDLVCDASCTIAQQRYANQSLGDVLSGGHGVVTGWRADGTGRARLRRLGGDGATAWVSLPATSTQEARIPVTADQLVGLDLGAGSRVPFVPASFSSDAYVLRAWEPARPDGAGTDGGDRFEGTPALQLDIEPDADRDGLGDHTQDPDRGSPPPPDTGGGGGSASGSPGTSTPPVVAPILPKPPATLVTTPALAKPKPGPAVPKSGPRVTLPAVLPATRKGVVTVTLANPYGQPLTGRLVAKAGKRRAASAALKLAADGSQTVKLKLTKAARTALGRSRKVKLQLTATLRGPAGKVGTARRTALARIGAKAPATGGPIQQPSGGTGTPAPTEPAPPTQDAPGFDGTYRASDGQVMVVEGGKVTNMNGSITLYCTRSEQQKLVGYAMVADDPDPVVAPDGTFAWEATTNYGFKKLKFDGRIVGNVAKGKLMVEDRSPLLGTGRMEFDYCFAGKDWELSR